MSNSCSRRGASQNLGLSRLRLCTSFMRELTCPNKRVATWLHGGMKWLRIKPCLRIVLCHLHRLICSFQRWKQVTLKLSTVSNWWICRKKSMVNSGWLILSLSSVKFSTNRLWETSSSHACSRPSNVSGVSPKNSNLWRVVTRRSTMWMSALKN
jgi:hypothetical protein